LLTDRQTDRETSKQTPSITLTRVGADHPRKPPWPGRGTGVKWPNHGVKGALKGPYW